MSTQTPNEPVLTVLDEIIAFGREAAEGRPDTHPGVIKLRRCEAARATVAELIEAARMARDGVGDWRGALDSALDSAYGEA